MAISKGYEEAVKLLLGQKYDYTYKEGNNFTTPLLLAIEAGNSSSFIFILGSTRIIPHCTISSGAASSTLQNVATILSFACCLTGKRPPKQGIALGHEDILRPVLDNTDADPSPAEIHRHALILAAQNGPQAMRMQSICY